MTVEIGSAEEVLRAAVTVAVAPGLGKIRLAVFQSLQRIVHIIGVCGGSYLIGLAGLSVEIEQIFGTGVHEELGHIAVLTVGAIVLRLVADNDGLARSGVKDGTIGSAHDALCLAVTVPVIGSDIGLVVLKVAEVGAAVDPPKQIAVELKHLDAVKVGTVGLVLGVIRGAELLDDEFHLAVTVYISDGGIVGLIDIGHVSLAVVGETFGLGDLEIVMRQHSGRLRTGGLLHSFYNRAHGIGATGSTSRISEIRYGEGFIVDLHTITVEVISDSVVFLRIDAPRTEDATRRLHGDKTAVELVCHTLCLGTCGQKHGQQPYQDVFLSHRKTN